MVGLTTQEVWALKIKCLDTIRIAINDALTAAHEAGLGMEHDRWFAPIREMRTTCEQEINYLYELQEAGGKAPQ